MIAGFEAALHRWNRLRAAPAPPGQSDQSLWRSTEPCFALPEARSGPCCRHGGSDTAPALWPRWTPTGRPGSRPGAAARRCPPGRRPWAAARTPMPGPWTGRCATGARPRGVERSGPGTGRPPRSRGAARRRCAVCRQRRPGVRHAGLVLELGHAPQLLDQGLFGSLEVQPAVMSGYGPRERSEGPCRVEQGPFGLLGQLGVGEPLRAVALGGVAERGLGPGRRGTDDTPAGGPARSREQHRKRIREVTQRSPGRGWTRRRPARQSGSCRRGTPGRCRR